MGEDKKWIMPEWMKSYEKMILNTGGNSIEDLVNDDGTNSNIFNNAPRALICASVKSQVGLLEQLYEKGLLKDAIRKTSDNPINVSGPRSPIPKKGNYV